MKILFVSGFLGAGKTRFIQKMSEATGRRFVIVENEFGDLDIDAERLRQQQEKTTSPFEKIVELSEGCICCSLNLNFNDSVLTIANSLDPDYLVVEPSGVAKTADILEKLKKITYERIGILAPVTILHAQLYAKSRRDFPEIFNSQIMTAGTLVVSHAENLTPEDFTEIAKDLHLPDDVRFPQKHYEQWTKEEWWSLLNHEYVDTKPRLLPEKGGKRRFVLKKKAAGPVLQSLAFTDYRCDTPLEMAGRLEVILRGAFGRVLRAKGFFPLAGLEEGIQFDLVDGYYSMTGCEARGGERRMVLIGPQLDREGLTHFFEATPYVKTVSEPDTEI